MSDQQPGNGIHWRLTNCEKQVEAFHKSAHDRMDSIDRRVSDAVAINSKVAVLEERVKGLVEEVHGLKRALWAFVFSVLTGAIILLLTIITGQFGTGA